MSVAAGRCAAHPARPAGDACPRCGRSRCAADARTFGPSGCAVCTTVPVAAPPAGSEELAARAGLATVPVALVGGWIVTQYVYDHIFSWLLPGLLGVVAAVAAAAAMPRGSRSAAVPVWLIPAVAAAAGVLGTALGFRLVPGGRQSVWHPLDVVGAPYLSAVVGAVIGFALLGPPGRRGQPGGLAR